MMATSAPMMTTAAPVMAAATDVDADSKSRTGIIRGTVIGLLIDGAIYRRRIDRRGIGGAAEIEVTAAGVANGSTETDTTPGAGAVQHIDARTAWHHRNDAVAGARAGAKIEV